jgi:hypothetical protein
MRDGRAGVGAVSVVGAAAVLAACTTRETTVVREDGTSEVHVAWKDMDRGQRLRHMKTVVFPAMKAEFQRFDPKDFGEFTCATCHGRGAEDKTFEMPNPELPQLPADEAGFRQLTVEEPKWVKFMSETVVPNMARMLDEKPHDPATNEGFGCFRCHTKK